MDLCFLLKPLQKNISVFKILSNAGYMCCFLFVPARTQKVGTIKCNFVQGVLDEAGEEGHSVV